MTATTLPRPIAVGLTLTLALLIFTSIRDSHGIQAANAAGALTWRQAEIIHERGRTHACQRALGKPLRPVGQRIVRGGWAYKRWVLRSWRRDRRFYCGALHRIRQQHDTVWDRLASCESGRDWSYNGSSGFDGGLQFHPDTWAATKPVGYPAYAYQATREQQIVVAGIVLRQQGWRAWPACARKLGLL